MKMDNSSKADSPERRQPLREGVHAVQSNDFPWIAEVWETSVRATHHFLTEADIHFFKPHVQNELRRLANLVCVRDVQGLLVGFVGFAEGKIEALFVHPTWRGTGVGRRLVSHAMTAGGASVVDVNEPNGQAIGFYLHLGFRIESRSELDGMGRPFPLLHLRLADELLSRSALLEEPE